MTGPCGFAGERLIARSPDNCFTAAASAATPVVAGCGTVARTIVPARASAAVAAVEPMLPLNAPKLASVAVLKALSSAATAAIVACGLERVAGPVLSLLQAAATSSAAQGDRRKNLEIRIADSLRGAMSCPLSAISYPNSRHS